MELLILTQEDQERQVSEIITELWSAENIDCPMQLMERVVDLQPSAVLVDSTRSDVDVVGLMEALRSVAPETARVVIDLPSNAQQCLQLLNDGRPHQIVSKDDDDDQWRATIAKAIAQNDELRRAVLENDELKETNGQLEFHLRQRMMVESES